MMMSVKASVFLLVLYFTTQISGLEVKSVPEVSGGFVHTELEKTVSLTCLSEPQEEELVWLRNGQLVSIAAGNTRGSSRLCVTPVTHKDHAAIFTCQMKNNASVNASVQLEVTYAPLHSGKEEVSVEQTREMELSCDVFANPPVLVSWQQHGDPIHLSEGAFLLSNDGCKSRLKVGRVDRAVHQGLYSCVTSSPVYPNRTKSFEVTVTDKTIQFQTDLIFPMIAGLVVIGCTILLAIVSRWRWITQCCK
ncbi:transmembrane and immunoglobulin domain-containing protein 1 [Salvelinus alpinus]|uniref:transmembrane and immunoglobulin domain-containing protein 1 n=1 Tax=Salvelinus alpinus TaxID=8036 RepID=UPI0039FD3E2D